jgi:ABC-type Fe3+/spermidine/putrescine transport system ATPase subunit
LSRLIINALAKSYGGTPVLRSIALDIAAGEFFTLLGPSGCGKTTLLRTIAGFLRQDSGEIRIGEERIDDVPAHRRDIGMVFQDYAIFPHLTVSDNVGFGLKARRLPRAAIASRVAESLEMVRLKGYDARYPSELSGGQQQRVGLARALAIRPRLLLMDEPLSNLDAKLRIELREDIRDLQKRLGITTVYVTHDQEEALAVSDRICVMHNGQAEQIAAPFDIYREPATRFAAAFVGAMNFLGAGLRDGEVHIGDRPTGLRSAGDRAVSEVAIRPENVLIDPGQADRPALRIEGRIRKVSFLGREAHCAIATPLGEIVAQVADPKRDLAEQADRHIVIGLPRDRLILFASDGSRVPALAGA